MAIITIFEIIIHRNALHNIIKVINSWDAKTWMDLITKLL
jgi:hypothetical protein